MRLNLQEDASAGVDGVTYEELNSPRKIRSDNSFDRPPGCVACFPLPSVEKVEEELSKRYQRVKMKINPGKDLDFVAAVRKRNHEHPMRHPFQV